MVGFPDRLIITSLARPGTWPVDQLPAVVQLLSPALPVHVTVEGNLTFPNSVPLFCTGSIKLMLVPDERAIMDPWLTSRFPAMPLPIPPLPDPVRTVTCGP